MDLRSARRRASWHPLTSLIEFEGAWSDRPFYGIPFVSDPPAVCGRSVITTIHHELTHHASARTTRLGFALSAEAARLLAEFRAGRQAHLSSRIAAILGTYTPILEGLALFAELDFEERKDDLILPNPITVHTQSLALSMSSSEETIVRVARNDQIFERPALPARTFQTPDDPGQSLLRLLFANREAPELDYYLVGYLWVKAAVAVITRQNARLARPTILLPFLIKLLCDHPVITKIWQGTAGQKELRGALLRTINALEPSSLGRVERALARPELVASFELWDLHTFLDDPSCMIPSLSKPEVSNAFFGTEPDGVDVQARALASIYLPSRTSGKLVDLEADTTGLHLKIETASGESPSTETRSDGHAHDEVTIVPPLLRIGSYWNMLAGSENHSRVVSKHLDNAMKLEALVIDKIRTWRGRKITIANYWAFASPTLFGLAFWNDAGEMVQLPYEPQWFDRSENIQLTQAGLNISVDERLRFAKWLRSSSRLDAARRDGTAAYLGNLVTKGSARLQILQEGLPGVLTTAANTALEEWVACPFFRSSPWTLSRPATDELDVLFDMPGFSYLRGRFRFHELLPSIGASML